DAVGMARGVASRDDAAERDPTERGAAGDAGGIDDLLELPDESVEAGVRVHPLSRAEVAAQRIAHDAEMPRQIAQHLARPLPASLERLHDYERWTGPLIEHGWLRCQLLNAATPNSQPGVRPPNRRLQCQTPRNDVLQT